MKTDYISEAHVTLSNSYHGEKVTKAYFAAVVTDAILALQAVDGIKKALFYGRQDITDYLPSQDFNEFGELDCDELGLELLAHDRSKSINLLHGMIGKATECGELLEALFASVIQNKPLDATNVSEEVGDGLWYDAIILKALGSTFEAEMARNINKLRHRFPDKFTEFDANNRNLFAERQILEEKPLDIV